MKAECVSLLRWICCLLFLKGVGSNTRPWRRSKAGLYSLLGGFWLKARVQRCSAKVGCPPQRPAVPGQEEPNAKQPWKKKERILFLYHEPLLAGQGSSGAASSPRYVYLVTLRAQAHEMSISSCKTRKLDCKGPMTKF